MIPKVEACLDCLEAGVLKTHIIDGRLPHALLLEIFTHTGIGSEIVGKELPRIHPPPADDRSRPGLESFLVASLQCSVFSFQCSVNEQALTLTV